MAVDPKSLTVDFRQLMRMTARDRQGIVQSSLGQSIISALSPTQLAMMFPDYYKKGGADLGQTGNEPTSKESARFLSGSNLSGGSSGGSGGGSGGGSYSNASEVSPQKQSWLDKIQAAQDERKLQLAIKSGKLNPLGAKRTQVSSQLSKEDKIHLYALTMAEVGRDDPKAQRALMETIYNRYEAQGYKKLQDVTTAAYYEPLRSHTRGYQNYLKAKADLESNPDLFKEMDTRHTEVLFGSNDSNFATHNSSAGVAANARKNQTIASVVGGETMSRKDLQAGADEHGAGTVKAERAWYEKYKAEMEAWPGTQAMAEASAIPEQDPNQTGSILPKQDASTLQPVNPTVTPSPLVLPPGIDPNIQKYYEKLTPEDQQGFLKKIEGLPVEQLNKIAQENANEIIAEVAGGKRLPTDKVVDIAMKVKGLHEVRDRSAIKEYLRHGKGSVVDPNDRWCANFVNASLEQAGIRGSESPAAGSFQTWGEKVNDPTEIKRGDVLVNRKRSTTTNMIGSHVVIATGPAYKDKNGNWKVPTIGGNQSMQGNYDKGSHYVSETTVDFSSWNARRARPQDFYDPSVLEQDPSQTGTVQPKQDNSVLQPVTQTPAAPENSTANPVKPEEPKAPATAPETVIPKEDPLKGAISTLSESMGNMTIQDAYGPESEANEATKNTLRQMKERMPGIDFQKTTIKELNDQLSKTATPVPNNAAPAEAPKETPSEAPKEAAPAQVSEAPKPEPEKPKMKTGGEVQGTGEDFTLLDNNTGQKLGEISRNENINVKQNGRVEVTPDHRLNPIELENQKSQQLQKMQEPEEPKAMAQPAPMPVSQPTNWANHEMFGYAPTPNSYVRAMEQTRGRRNDGVFAGSRFGESHTKTID